MDDLWKSSLSSNTQAVYHTGLHCLLTFLTMSGVNIQSGELPIIHEEVLIYFVTYCHTSLKLKWTTIKLYLAGIRFHYLKAGFSNPLQAVDRLQYILRGIKRTQCQPSKPRLPITIQKLQEICKFLKTDFFPLIISRTLECMCMIAFFGFLRCSEFTAGSFQKHYLCIKDIKFPRDRSMFILFLASSKTDPFRHGVKIPIYSNPVLCPVTCMQHYLSKYHKEPQNSEAPLFLDEHNHPFSRERFISYLRQILVCLGYNQSDYCGHSFRIGAATTAAAVGIEDHMIKLLGRWKSSCYSRYIHVDQNLIKQAQQRLST